jgi:glutathione S-transferase
MLELYHAEPIANSVKVLICLFEKGLEFKSHYVNLLAFEQHQPEYLAINPNGIVPTLVDNGTIITESTVINEYLDDRFPTPPLKPADAAARARMRIWTKWVDDYFGPNASRIGWQFMLRPLAQKLGAEKMAERLSRIPMSDRRKKWATIAGDGFSETELEEALSWVAEGVERLERILADGRWTAGDDYSLSDIATYCVVPGLQMMPHLIGPGQTPGILRWLEAMNARPAVRRALAMPNKALETLRAVGP